MKFTYLLDTNTFSYIASGASPTARAEFSRLLKDPDAELCISVITEAEVRYGMAKRALATKRCQAIEGLFVNLQILPWGSEEAAAYGKTRAALEACGRTVAAMDMLIAAHALSIDAVLVAADHIFSDIAEIAGLSATVNWAKEF